MLVLTPILSHVVGEGESSQCFSHFEPPGVTGGNDLTGGRAGEMCGQNRDTAIGIAIQESAPRLPRLLWVRAEAATPLRFGALHGMVHQVAGHDGFLSPGLHV